MIKTLHLFRHGQTDWNVALRLQGHTDIPLNDEGKRQALSLQSYFKEHPVELFLTSDLKRARETAEIANGLLKCPLQTHPGLREAFLGDIEGQIKPDVLKIYGESDWEKWNSISQEHVDFAYPKAESARQMVARVLETLKIFCQTHDFKAAGVCTHGLVLRKLLHFLNPTLTEVLPVPNCVVYQLKFDTAEETFQVLL